MRYKLTVNGKANTVDVLGTCHCFGCCGMS
jgi:hypothetical protein